MGICCSNDCTGCPFNDDVIFPEDRERGVDVEIVPPSGFGDLSIADRLRCVARQWARQFYAGVSAAEKVRHSPIRHVEAVAQETLSCYSGVIYGKPLSPEILARGPEALYALAVIAPVYDLDFPFGGTWFSDPSKFPLTGQQYLDAAKAILADGPYKDRLGDLSALEKDLETELIGLREAAERRLVEAIFGRTRRDLEGALGVDVEIEKQTAFNRAADVEAECGVRGVGEETEKGGGKGDSKYDADGLCTICHRTDCYWNPPKKPEPESRKCPVCGDTNCPLDPSVCPRGERQWVSW